MRQLQEHYCVHPAFFIFLYLSGLPLPGDDNHNGIVFKSLYF